MNRSACAESVKLVDSSAVMKIVPVRVRPTRAEPPTKVRRPRGTDDATPPRPAKHEGLGAEAPDAAPRRLDHVVRAVAHAVVLAAVVGFVVVYCVVMPLHAQFAGRLDRASVILVANPLLEVRAPDIEGVFRAQRPLPHGAPVRKGQVLGQIDAPKLDDEIARASLNLRILEARQLRLDHRLSAGDPTADEARESRELGGQVAAASQALAQRRGLRQALRLVAPADGVVQQGVPARLTVAPHQQVALIYPAGGDLLVEVSAPLDVLNGLLRRDSLEAEIQTTDGAVRVMATPVPGSMRHFTKTMDGRREETWATVQCVPAHLPATVRSPGLLGKIRS
jgi:hypothetical protein